MFEKFSYQLSAKSRPGVDTIPPPCRNRLVPPATDDQHTHQRVASVKLSVSLEVAVRQIVGVVHLLLGHRLLDDGTSSSSFSSSDSMGAGCTHTHPHPISRVDIWSIRAPRRERT